MDTPNEFDGIDPDNMMDISKLPRSDGEYTFIHGDAK